MKCKWPCRSLSPSILYFWAIESLLHRSFSQSHDIKIWAEAVGAVGHLLPDLTYSGFTHRHVMERKFWSDFYRWISIDSNTLWMTPHREPEQPWGPSSVPLSGMSSLQGKAKGVMECWHTNGHHRNQIDYILCSQRWRSSIQTAKTRLRTDCGSDHELLIAKFRLKMKKSRENH